jgi:hypothetical protein
MEFRRSGCESEAQAKTGSKLHWERPAGHPHSRLRGILWSARARKPEILHAVLKSVSLLADLLKPKG